MAVKRNYKLQSEVVLWPGEQGAWHFAYVDKKQSAQIKKDFAAQRRGFGSLRVAVTLGHTTWRTSIFPDSRSGSYLLPLKAQVRKREGVQDGDKIRFSLEIL